MENIVDIPSDVSVSIEGHKVSAKGPKGSLDRDFDDPRFNHIIFIEQKDGKVTVKSDDEHRKVKALCGSIASHIKNMMIGVKTGYKYEMKIVFTHFPINITKTGEEIHIKNFLGEKGARIAQIESGADVHIDKEHIEVKGADVEAVGQTAANIELACKVKGRDRRVFQDGIYLSGRHLQTGGKL